VRSGCGVAGGVEVVFGVRDRRGVDVGGVVRGVVPEPEVPLGRVAGTGEAGEVVGQAEVAEEALSHPGLEDDRDELEAAAAVRTLEDVDGEDSGYEGSPVEASEAERGAAVVASEAGATATALAVARVAAGVGGAGRDDVASQAGARRQNSMISYKIRLRGWDERQEPADEVERLEDEGLGAGGPELRSE
jgi:hypothetical protein